MGSLDLDVIHSVKLVIEEFSNESHQILSMKEDPVENTEASFSALEGQLILLKAAYALSNVNRRLSLSKLLDLQGNVRVFCRVRPYPSCEPHDISPLEVVSPLEIRISCHGEPPKSFKFDKVFPPSATQEDVFWDVQPTIKSALDGHNVCIFSYGQTGTGKTYTMEGNKSAPGIVPRTLQQLFKDIENSCSVYRLSLSMLEIYKGALRDLLVPRATKIMDPPPKSLSIHSSVSDHIEVENLTEYVIENASDALKFYRKGIRARTTSSTSSNESSSRSHCLVRISILRDTVDKKRSSSSKLWLIDLGGSERFFKTQAWGKPLEEGKAINVSLTALGDVMSALQKKQPHIPYRNSKLTQILRDCLGCNSKVVMLAHVSPKEEDYGETVCSLSFASRLRGMHLHREPAKIQEREARMSSIVGKMEALEGECKRLSIDIHTLESTIKQKKGELDEKFNEGLTKSNDYGGKSIVASNHHHHQSLPRFMTPTISSLCKNRMSVHEFEPVFPDTTVPRYTSINLGSAKARRSHDNHQVISANHQLINKDHQRAKVEQECYETPKKVVPSSVTKGMSSHLRSNSFKEDVPRNMAKIQRRLTLECSSKLSVHI